MSDAFGNLEFLTSHLKDPKAKLLQKWNYRKKEFGLRNIGERVISKALHKWCEICDVPNDKVNNMWARKTFVNTGIHDLQLPAQQVMNVSGHKNEVQMRKGYRGNMIGKIIVAS